MLRRFRCVQIIPKYAAMPQVYCWPASINVYQFLWPVVHVRPLRSMKSIDIFHSNNNRSPYLFYGHIDVHPWDPLYVSFIA